MGSLIQLEPELAEAFDMPGVLQAWCERHSGPCHPVDEIVASEPTEADPGRLVSVRLRTASGEPVIFRDGTTVTTLHVGWFESELFLLDLPAART